MGMRFRLVFVAALAPSAASCGQSDQHAPPIGSLGGSGGGTSNDKACWAKPSIESCLPCCQSEHPGGAEAWFDAMQPCVCQHCSSECAASVCADPVGFVDEACMTCLTDALMSGGACEAAFQSACSASPECAALEACESGC